MSIYTFYVEVFIATVEGFLALLWYEAIYDRNGFILKNKVKTVLFCLTYAVASYYATEYTPAGIHTFLILIFLIMLMSFITKRRIIPSTVIVVGYCLQLFTIEAIFMAFYMTVTRSGMNSLLNSDNLAKCIIATGIKAVHFLLIYLVIRSKLKIPFRPSALNENLACPYFVLQLFVFGMIITSVNYTLFSGENIITFGILSFLLYVVFMFLGISDIRERSRLLVVQSKYQLQEKQLQNMEQMLNMIRKDKHDFLNHLNTIHLISALKEPDGLEQISHYITSLSDSMKASCRYFGTGNSYIDALLAIKSDYAAKTGIKFEVVVDEPLRLSGCSDNEMVSIISNLVDNAIEAVEGEEYENKERHENEERHENKERFVSLKIYKVKDNLYIEVADNGKTIPEEIKESIFEQGFTTKGKKPESGYGLFIVKQLVAKNKGKIIVESARELTRFTVEFTGIKPQT